MKTTAQKRTDLVDLLNGKKSLTEISLGSVGSLYITGNIDIPQYWIGSRKVEKDEFIQCFEWLDKNLPGIILDWSTENEYNIIIPIPDMSNDL